MANKKISDLEEALSTDGFYVSTSDNTNATRMYISGPYSSTSGLFNINIKASSQFTITAELVTKATITRDWLYEEVEGKYYYNKEQSILQ